MSDNQSASDGPKERLETRKKHPLDYVYIWFSVIAAIATVIAAVFAFRATLIAKESEKIQDRAYLGEKISQFTISYDRTTPTALVFVTEVHNYGASPATGVVLHRAFVVMPYPLTKNYQPTYDENDPNDSSVIFQGTSIKRSYNKDFPLSELKLSHRQDLNTLYSFTSIDYKDVFGDDHHSTFTQILTTSWDELLTPSLSSQAARLSPGSAIPGNVSVTWSTIPERPSVID